MLDCLGNKAVVSTMLPILGGSVTVPKQMDLDLESTPVCSPSESEICHCVYLHELPDSKAQMKTFISIARVFGGKEEEGN